MCFESLDTVHERHKSIFLLAIAATPIDHAHCWAGGDHQHYRSISVQKSADAKHMWGMCSREL